MARYIPTHKGLKLLPVDFDRQVIPGSFEHALCYLVDHELDLALFHARYKNDDNGAPAFDPAVLNKIVLLAYSRGMISSRKMEAACRENVLFIVVSGDTPVFGNLRGNKRLNRFTLRGATKVDGQWKLYCMMHNIEKLAHHGYAVH